MIALCVEFRTVTPLGEMSWRDLIYLGEFRREDARSRNLPQQDIRAILYHILRCVGGGDDAGNWMPTELYVMGKRLEKLNRK